MGPVCEICGTNVSGCVMPGDHPGKDANGLAVRHEILFGNEEVERRVDSVMGCEVKEFKWKGETMEDVEERVAWRVYGKTAAETQVGARETRIGREKCEICMVTRTECD